MFAIHHPTHLLDLALDHQKKLLANADRERLLAQARQPKPTWSRFATLLPLLRGPQIQPERPPLSPLSAG